MIMNMRTINSVLGLQLSQSPDWQLNIATVWLYMLFRTLLLSYGHFSFLLQFVLSHHSSLMQ